MKQKHALLSMATAHTCGYKSAHATLRPGAESIPGIILLSTVDIAFRVIFQEVKLQGILNEAEFFSKASP